MARRNETGRPAPADVEIPRAGDAEIEVDGKHVRLTSLDKVLYPAAGFSKHDVVEYCRRIAPLMVPHLADRPISRKRYPNGVDAEFFWEKDCPNHRPDWIRTVAIWTPSSKREVDYCLVNDTPSLLWLANLAALELHVSLSRVADLARPTALVFDLDPGPPATIVECCRVALWIRDDLARLGLECFAKTSGSKGLQLYAPLNTPVSYEQTKPFAHDLALRLERDHRDLVVSKMRRTLRPGKVLIDWSQNDDHKTTVGVYSLRAKARPTVSTPVTWDEVEQTASEGDPERLMFDARQVLERVERLGDLFEPVLNVRQSLPRIGEASS